MLTKDSDCLANILESIKKIDEYSIQIQNADELNNDSKSFDAILMNFVIIGEMVAKISEEFKIEMIILNGGKLKGLGILWHTIILELTQRKFGKLLKTNSPN